MSSIGVVVMGGVDRSGREHVVPTLLSLIDRLARRHDVHVFALGHYPEPCTYPLRGATVHDVGRVDRPRGLRRFVLQQRLAAAIASVSTARRFDLLHAYLGIPAIVATAAARRSRLPVVVTLDSGELVRDDEIGYGLQRRLIDRRAVARAMRAAARVTVTTNHMRNLAAAAAPGVPVEVVPLGIEVGEFHAAPREGPPRLLRVGSLNRVKDYPMLLRALARVASTMPDVHLDIVGEDTLDGAVQQLSASLGVAAHVTFHGLQPADRRPWFYERAHLHVVSSRHEAAGVVVLEAAAAGVPTVGTDVGILADWSRDTIERAVVVPVGDDAALAAAIVAVLNDRPRAERLAAGAREWALAHDADWTAREFERIYNETAMSASRR